MIGKILCFFMWHKWGGKMYSVKYRRQGVWSQTVSVNCQRPGCKAGKHVIRKV